MVAAAAARRLLNCCLYAGSELCVSPSEICKSNQTSKILEFDQKMDILNMN